MVLLGVGAAAAGLAAGKSMFSYNREAWETDIFLDQTRRYQKQNVLMTQADMFRDDIRDLAGACVTVQANYVLVSTLFLGFVADIYVNGPLPDAAPEYLKAVFSLCVGSSLLYLVLAVICSVTATNLATNCQRDLLTKNIRIPIEDMVREIDDWARIESIEAFEHQAVDTMFRLPGWSRFRSSVPTSPDIPSQRPPRFGLFGGRSSASSCSGASSSAGGRPAPSTGGRGGGGGGGGGGAGLGLEEEEELERGSTTNSTRGAEAAAAAAARSGRASPNTRASVSGAASVVSEDIPHKQITPPYMDAKIFREKVHEHFALFKKCEREWEVLARFSFVFNTLGANHLLSAWGYFSSARWFVGDSWSGGCVHILIILINAIVARVSLTTALSLGYLASLLNVLGPVCFMAAIRIDHKAVKAALVCCGFALHCLWTVVGTYHIWNVSRGKVKTGEGAMGIASNNSSSNLTLNLLSSFSSSPDLTARSTPRESLTASSISTAASSLTPQELRANYTRAIINQAMMTEGFGPPHPNRAQRVWGADRVTKVTSGGSEGDYPSTGRCGFSQVCPAASASAFGLNHSESLLSSSATPQRQNSSFFSPRSGPPPRRNTFGSFRSNNNNNNTGSSNNNSNNGNETGNGNGRDSNSFAGAGQESEAAAAGEANDEEALAASNLESPDIFRSKMRRRFNIIFLGNGVVLMGWVMTFVWALSQIHSPDFRELQDDFGNLASLPSLPPIQEWAFKADHSSALFHPSSLACGLAQSGEEYCFMANEFLVARVLWPTNHHNRNEPSMEVGSLPELGSASAELWSCDLGGSILDLTVDCASSSLSSSSSFSSLLGTSAAVDHCWPVLLLQGPKGATFTRSCRNGAWDLPQESLAESDALKLQLELELGFGFGLPPRHDVGGIRESSSGDAVVAGRAVPIETPQGVNVHHIALSHNSSGQIGGDRALFSAEHERVVRRHIPAKSRFSSSRARMTSQDPEADDGGAGLTLQPTSWAPLWPVLELLDSASSSLLALDFSNLMAPNLGLLLLIHEVHGRTARPVGRLGGLDSSSLFSSLPSLISSSFSASSSSSSAASKAPGTGDLVSGEREVVVELAFSETGTLCAQGRVQLTGSEVLKSGTWHVGRKGAPELLLLLLQQEQQESDGAHEGERPPRPGRRSRRDWRTRPAPAQAEVRLKAVDLTALHLQCSHSPSSEDVKSEGDGMTKSTTPPTLVSQLPGEDAETIVLQKVSQQLRG